MMKAGSMRRCARRIATRRISCIDQGTCKLGDGRRFWGRAVRQLTHPRQHGKGQHHQRDMPVPAVPRPALIVGQSEFCLGGLERVFNRPAPPLNGHQLLDRRARRAPRRKIGQAPVRQAAPHQKTTRPQALVERGVERVSLQRSQLQIGPVVQARPLSTRPAERRIQSSSTRAVAISSAVPDPAASAPQDQNECWPVTPRT